MADNNVNIFIANFNDRGRSVASTTESSSPGQNDDILKIGTRVMCVFVENHRVYPATVVQRTQGHRNFTPGTTGGQSEEGEEELEGREDNAPSSPRHGTDIEYIVEWDDWTLGNRDKGSKPRKLLTPLPMHEEPPPEFLIVSGRMGICSQINGKYTRMAYRNGKIFYCKIVGGRTSGIMIRWAQNKRTHQLEWMIDKKGYASSVEDVSHPGLVTGDWTVHDGENSFSDPHLKIEALEAALTRVVRTPEVLMAHGFSRDKAAMNGTYLRGPDLHEGEVFYEKLEGSKQWVMRWNSAEACWMMNSKKLRHDGKCSARLKQRVRHPGLGTAPWEVQNPGDTRSGNKFIPSPKIVISIDNTMGVVSKLREWFLHNVLKFLTLYAEDRQEGIKAFRRESKQMLSRILRDNHFVTTVNQTMRVALAQMETELTDMLRSKKNEIGDEIAHLLHYTKIVSDAKAWFEESSEKLISEYQPLHAAVREFKSRLQPMIAQQILDNAAEALGPQLKVLEEELETLFVRRHEEIMGKEIVFLLETVKQWYAQNHARYLNGSISNAMDGIQDEIERVIEETIHHSVLLNVRPLQVDKLIIQLRDDLRDKHQELLEEEAKKLHREAYRWFEDVAPQMIEEHRQIESISDILQDQLSDFLISWVQESRVLMRVPENFEANLFPELQELIIEQHQHKLDGAIGNLRKTMNEWFQEKVPFYLGAFQPIELAIRKMEAQQDHKLSKFMNSNFLQSNVDALKKELKLASHMRKLYKQIISSIVSHPLKLELTYTQCCIYHPITNTLATIPYSVVKPIAQAIGKSSHYTAFCFFQGYPPTQDNTSYGGNPFVGWSILPGEVTFKCVTFNSKNGFTGEVSKSEHGNDWPKMAHLSGLWDLIKSQANPEFKEGFQSAYIEYFEESVKHTVQRQEKNLSKNVKNWDKAHVTQWVRELGAAYEKYLPNFYENEVDGEFLLVLDDEDLQLLGIANKIHRKKFLTAVKKLVNTFE